MNEPIIRPIQKKDNPAVAQLIRSVLTELNMPKTGTAFEDPELDCMFESYNKTNAAYFVVEEHGKLVGGAGIAQLANYDGNIC